jgi:hypothetical protein
MSGNKQWFLNLDETFRQVVKLGNNLNMAVMGKETSDCNSMEQIR